jgi:hypothetical protein
MQRIKQINNLLIAQITKADTQRNSECFNLEPGTYVVYDQKAHIVEMSDDNLNCCIEFAECYNN